MVHASVCRVVHKRATAACTCETSQGARGFVLMIMLIRVQTGNEARHVLQYCADTQMHPNTSSHLSPTCTTRLCVDQTHAHGDGHNDVAQNHSPN